VRRSVVLSIAIAVAIGVVAALGGFRFIRIKDAEPTRLVQLEPATPPAGFKPYASHVVDAPLSAFAAGKSAARRSPDATGSYTKEWQGPSSTSDDATVSLSLVPTTSEAATVQSEATTADLSRGSFSSQSVSLQSRFPVAGTTDTNGALFAAPSGPNIGVVVQRVGRIVAVVTVKQSGPASQAQTTAQTMAQSEYHLLRQVEPGFSLVQTRWPISATSIYSAVAVILAAVVIGGPVAVRRVRRKRRTAHEEALRRQVMARGGKIAKRHAAHRH
jgi:hypothetical protein